MPELVGLMKEMILQQGKTNANLEALTAEVREMRGELRTAIARQDQHEAPASSSKPPSSSPPGPAGPRAPQAKPLP